MRAQTVIGVALAGLAAAAVAQVATAPLEQKGGANVQVDEPAPASNRTLLANEAPPANGVAPANDAMPADPANAAAPVESKR